jgi:hypothetical protein
MSKILNEYMHNIIIIQNLITFHYKNKKIVENNNNFQT